jgi:hypothetical protein
MRGLFSLQLDQPADAVKSLEAALAVNAQRPAGPAVVRWRAWPARTSTLKSYPAAIEWARKAIARQQVRHRCRRCWCGPATSINDYPAW